MNMNRSDAQEAIDSAKTVLGIEFGSTRIKAVLIDEDHTPIASVSYEWENRYENGIWTYGLEDVWTGLQESYRKLSKEVFENYNTPLQTIGAIGFSAMMHGYMIFGQRRKAAQLRFAHGETLQPRRPPQPSLNCSNSTFPIVGVDLNRGSES
jgi:hypothetical protein